MSSPRLTPGKAALLMLGIGTASVVGLPGSGYEPPRGALAGAVLDNEGRAVPDVPVALFDDASLALIEITHTDPQGRFALQQAPERFHLCARPAASTGLLPGWLLDLERGPSMAIDLVLQRGIPIDVAVRDGEGHPVPGADVRCYRIESRACQVVARIRTDVRGRARLLAPARAHVGVFGPEPELLPAWSFYARPDPLDELVLDLPRGRSLHGRVTSEDERGLRDVVVSAWDERESWQWDGYRLTEEDGSFALHAGAGTVEVRALDRTQSHLSARALAGPTPRLDLVLPSAEQVEIRCETADGAALPARVWVCSASTGTWSWGSPTDEHGRLSVAGAGELRAVARPLHGGHGESGGSADPHLWSTERHADAVVLTRAEDP